MTDETLPGGAAEVRPDIIFKDLAVFDGDKPALNTIEGVEGVVRAFVKRMVDFRAAYLEKGRAESATGFVETEAKSLREVFFGRDGDYAATPWNSPDQLGYAFGDRVRLDGSPEDVMLAYWVRFASDLFDLMAKHEGGMDDDKAKFALDVMVEEAVYALLGLPLSAD